MALTTGTLGLPFPEGSDNNDVAGDLQDLAMRLDEVPGVESLTSAEIAALGAGEKPEGRVVYNSTTQTVQVSDGTSFVDVSAASTVGTFSAHTVTVTASTSNPTDVTSSAHYTRIGDLVHYEGSVTIPVATKGSGTYYFSLPVSTPLSAYAFPLGQATGTMVAGAVCYPQTSTTFWVLLAYGDSLTSADVSGDDYTLLFNLTYRTTA